MIKFLSYLYNIEINEKFKSLIVNLILKIIFH